MSAATPPTATDDGESDGESRLIVSLGSNIDAGRYLPAALRKLRAEDGFEVVAHSPVYASAPVGRADQPVFFNSAVRLRSRLRDPVAIRAVFRRIETELDRVRDPDDPCGPRTIDLDLILIDGVQNAKPQLPDDDLFAYWFVAVPAADVAADCPVPGSGETIGQIAERFRDPAAPPREAYGWMPGETVPAACGRPAEPPRYVPRGDG